MALTPVCQQGMDGGQGWPGMVARDGGQGWWPGMVAKDGGQGWWPGMAREGGQGAAPPSTLHW